MVLPEGTEPPRRDKPSAPTLAGIGAALVLVLGSLLVLGQLTTPSQEAIAEDTTTTTAADQDPLGAPTTTTTIDVDSFAASDITTGRRFSWIKSPGLGRLWPIDLVLHRGLVYLLGSEEVSETGGTPLGLSGWRSEDGISWSRIPSPDASEAANSVLAPLIPADHAISRVLSAGESLVALSSRLSDGAPVVWTSPDGLDWTSSELPIDVSLLETSSYRLEAAAYFDNELLVSGVMQTGSLELLANALPVELVGENHTAVEFGFRLRPGGGIVEAYGPLGLHAFSIRLDELGLDDLTESDLFGPQPPARQFVWSSRDSETWHQEELQSSIAEEMWVRPDGTLVAYGSGERQSTISLTSDGETWHLSPRSSRAWIFQISAQTVWEDQLVGSGLGKELFTTHDGLDWQYAGTGDLLPDAINWRLRPVAGGDGGLAVVATALRANSAPTRSPVIIEKDQTTITIDTEASVLRLAHPDVEEITIPLWATETSSLVDVDFVAQEVTFNHPETDEPLVTIAFATLEAAESSASRFDADAHADAERALLFTPDGTEWSVQSLTEEIGPSSAVDDMVVLEDRVVMITSPSQAASGSATPAITIRVGLIR